MGPRIGARRSRDATQLRSGRQNGGFIMQRMASGRSGTWALAGMAVVALALAGCGSGGERIAGTSQAIVAGAGFTTFDATLGGCKDSPNGVNCNNYEAKLDVYMSGGPSAAGLSDGSYYFAVLTPGTQNGGFADGAQGNLSDTMAGGTAGDGGSGDDVSNRTFTVSNHQVASYTGTHATGTSPNGRSIIGLAPFDDTDNEGGVYILAVCQTGATSPSQCKYDAFRIAARQPKFPVVSGMKYYDANANGQLDPGEIGIPSWIVDYSDAVAGSVTTDPDGTFSVTLIADTYTFAERQAGSPWFQTGNAVDQSSTTGGAGVTLNAGKTYTVTVADDSTASGVLFGNVCVGAGGGLTLGFWSNKNGQALFGADDLALMVSLNLRNASGGDFDPPGYGAFRSWILGATATNMALMLSAQLAAMELNVLNGFVSSGALVYAPGTNSANASGFASVGAIMSEANTELGLHGLTLDGSPARSYQQALKNALDNANNNRTFVQPSPATCPTPVFPQ